MCVDVACGDGLLVYNYSKVGKSLCFPIMFIYKFTNYSLSIHSFEKINQTN